MWLFPTTTKTPSKNYFVFIFLYFLYNVLYYYIYFYFFSEYKIHEARASYLSIIIVQVPRTAATYNNFKWTFVALRNTLFSFKD